MKNKTRKNKELKMFWDLGINPIVMFRIDSLDAMSKKFQTNKKTEQWTETK